MNLRQFLKIYKEKNRANILDILQYYQQFSAILQNLIVKEKFDSFMQSCWFL